MKNYDIQAKQAYQTLSDAIDAAKRELARAERVDVRILADSGEYTITETQMLTRKDQGHPESTLTLMASGEEKPTVTGLQSFSGSDFRRVSGAPYLVGCPIWRAMKTAIFRSSVIFTLTVAVHAWHV